MRLLVLSGHTLTCLNKKNGHPGKSSQTGRNIATNIWMQTRRVRTSKPRIRCWSEIVVSFSYGTTTIYIQSGPWRTRQRRKHCLCTFLHMYVRGTFLFPFNASTYIVVTSKAPPFPFLSFHSRFQLPDADHCVYYVCIYSMIVIPSGCWLLAVYGNCFRETGDGQTVGNFLSGCMHASPYFLQR